MKDLVILLSIYKYLEIPWGDPNIEHMKIFIIYLNIFTFEFFTPCSNNEYQLFPKEGALGWPKSYTTFHITVG